MIKNLQEYARNGRSQEDQTHISATPHEPEKGRRQRGTPASEFLPPGSQKQCHCRIKGKDIDGTFTFSHGVKKEDGRTPHQEIEESILSPGATALIEKHGERGKE